MDLDGDEDIFMGEDIIASTEPPGLISNDIPTYDHLNDRAASHATSSGSNAFTKASELPLKGAGLKRDGNIFDYRLTKRKDAPRPAKYRNLPYATLQTGLVYDVRMRFHVELIPDEDDMHPEDPRRIHAIFEAFVDAGLAWADGSIGPSNEFYMGRIDVRKVTKEEVLLVHTEAHYNWLQSVAAWENDEHHHPLQHPDQIKMDSIYTSPLTPYCAALSAGGAIEACRAVLLSKVKNVFAVIRPPGHHAEREDAKGFCFYDNVSIATKVCQREFGERCRKVFILDWDVHHGNGIQQANYDDPNVLYTSLHLHKGGRFYPELSYRDDRQYYGDHLHCGQGAGLGKNVNIPWSRSGMGDADYVYAFQQIVMPIATEFDPDLVIIAAGFDAAEGDLLGECKVTPAGYAHMTHMLMSLAQGRLAVCLEGGYNLDSIARSATAVARTMMGEPPERLRDMDPSASGVDDVKLVLRQQSRFWSCLYPKDISARLSGPLNGERMHDVIRRWQAATLWDEYEMSPLFVYNKQLSKSFENQVLATSNYTEARPLLLILHDPPEVLASPDPRTGKIELHNTWLTDIVKTYIDWAVSQGFAVIDVNLPKHTTEVHDTNEHQDSNIVEDRAREATHLLTYLWDNYIELNESTHVFVIGTNTGHNAITNFIKQNEERAQEQLTAAISFVEDVPFQSCKSANYESLSLWYYACSLVFVGAEHNFWYSDHSHKRRKRFGKVTKSESRSVSDMLLEHKDAVLELLSQETEGWRAKQASAGNGSAMDVSGAVLAATGLSPSRGMPPIANFSPSASPRPGATRVKSPGVPAATRVDAMQAALPPQSGDNDPRLATRTLPAAAQQRSSRSPAPR